MRKLTLPLAAVLTLMGIFSAQASIPQFPKWMKTWHSACLKSSFSDECYASLSDNKVLQSLLGKGSGSQGALYVDFRAKPAKVAKGSKPTSQQKPIPMGLNCLATVCTTTLYIKNISHRVWNQSLRIELLTNSSQGLNPHAFGYPSIDFAKNPLKPQASVYATVKVFTPKIKGFFWRKFWVENLNSPNRQGLGNALETSIDLVPSFSQTPSPTTYIGQYENLLHLWHWDLGPGVISHR